MKELLGLFTVLTMTLAQPAAANPLLCGGEYAAVDQAIAPAFANRMTAKARNMPLVLNSLGPATPLYSAQNSFYFAGDVHGSWSIYAATMAALTSLRPSYLALEVPEGADQTAIWERFNNGRYGHPSFTPAALGAWQVLATWDNNFDPRTCPFYNTSNASWCQSPMMAMVTRAKQLGARIVPIDTKDCHRMRAPLGHRSVLVRNFVWAKNIFGLSGRVMVFGGRPHFSSTLGDNVQDYVALMRRSAGKPAAGFAYIDPLSPAELAREKEFVRTEFKEMN